MSITNTSRCGICKANNETVYWHKPEDEKEDIWCWCNKCSRIYSIEEYCRIVKIPRNEFLKNDFSFVKDKPMEVQAMKCPRSFVSLFDPSAEKGVQYIKSRGLSLEGDLYYDINKEGIVFPLYCDNTFCGAQIRLIKPWVSEDGEVTKVISIPGTRVGLLFYNWNQGPFSRNVKGIIVTEGAFNALAIEQSLNIAYGGINNNPWKVIACSGSGATKYHRETIKELKDRGLKVIIAFDTDAAGLKGLKKFKDSDALTHYAFTGDSEKDWNDVFKAMEPKEFAKWFLSKVVKND